MNINDTNVEIGVGDTDLLELYAQAHHLADKRKAKFKTKLTKGVDFSRNHQNIENLTVRRNKQLLTLGDPNMTYEERKKSGERKSRLETIPHDISSAINLGHKIISKFDKKSRMKWNNLFTSSTTPTGVSKNNIKTFVNNSMNQSSFKVNKSFLNKLNKIKP